MCVASESRVASKSYADAKYCHGYEHLSAKSEVNIPNRNQWSPHESCEMQQLATVL